MNSVSIMPFSRRETMNFSIDNSAYMLFYPGFFAYILIPCLLEQQGGGGGGVYL
jgi:hypothetical protein